MKPTHDFSVSGLRSTVVYNPNPNAMTVTAFGRVLPGRQSAVVPVDDPVVGRMLAAKMLVEDAKALALDDRPAATPSTAKSKKSKASVDQKQVVDEQPIVTEVVVDTEPEPAAEPAVEIEDQSIEATE